MAKINIPRGKGVSSKPTGRPLFTNTRLGSIGDEIAELGTAITSETSKAIQRKNEVVETDYITNSLIDTSEKATRVRDEMAKNREDFKGFADDFIKEYDSIIDKQIENAPTEKAKSSLKRSYAQNRINNFKQAFDFENKRIADSILTKSEANIDLISDKVFEFPGSLEESLDQIDLITDNVSNVLDDSNLAKFEENAKNKIADRYITGLMNQDIDKAIKVSQSDSFKNLVGSRLAKSYEESARTQKTRIDNEALRVEQEDRTRVKVERQIGILKGQITQAQLDKDLQDGLYGNKEYLTLSKELRSALKTEGSVADSIEDVKMQLELGLPFDTTNAKVKKNLDRYFEKVVEPSLTSENYDQSISSFIDQTSYIPSKVKSTVLAGLHNGDDETVAVNARRINSLTKSNPQLVRQFSATNDLARSKLIATSIEAGMPLEDTIKAADNMIAEKNSVLQDQRKKDFKKSKPQFDQDEVQTLFRNDPSDVPESMKEDWRTIYENYAVNLKMPFDQAEELTYEIINSEWGVVNTTGEPTYMKHAPEKYYNTKNLDPIWIEQDLNEDVIGILPEVGDYTLAVDPDTIGTETPGYMINYVNKEGVPLILRDNEGDILLWRPDIQTSKNAQRQIAEAEIRFNEDRENIEEREQEENRAFTNIGDGIL